MRHGDRSARDLLLAAFPIEHLLLLTNFPYVILDLLLPLEQCCCPRHHVVCRFLPPCHCTFFNVVGVAVVVDVAVAVAVVGGTVVVLVVVMAVVVVGVGALKVVAKCK